MEPCLNAKIDALDDEGCVHIPQGQGPGHDLSPAYPAGGRAGLIDMLPPSDEPGFVDSRLSG